MEQIKESETDLEEFIKTKNELNSKLQKEINLEDRFKIQEMIIKIEKQISDFKKIKKIKNNNEEILNNEINISKNNIEKEIKHIKKIIIKM